MSSPETQQVPWEAASPSLSVSIVPGAPKATRVMTQLGSTPVIRARKQHLDTCKSKKNPSQIREKHGGGGITHGNSEMRRDCAESVAQQVLEETNVVTVCILHFHHVSETPG